MLKGHGWIRKGGHSNRLRRDWKDIFPGGSLNAFFLVGRGVRDSYNRWLGFGERSVVGGDDQHQRWERKVGFWKA